MVDAYYGMFINGVAEGRKVHASDVESKFGEGRMVLAKDAKTKGMIDGNTTMDNLLKHELKISQNGGAKATPMIEEVIQATENKLGRQLTEKEKATGYRDWMIESSSKAQLSDEDRQRRYEVTSK
jgi:ClpP class serine protease